MAFVLLFVNRQEIQIFSEVGPNGLGRVVSHNISIYVICEKSPNHGFPDLRPKWDYLIFHRYVDFQKCNVKLSRKSKGTYHFCFYLLHNRAPSLPHVLGAPLSLAVPSTSFCCYSSHPSPTPWVLWTLSLSLAHNSDLAHYQHETGRRCARGSQCFKLFSSSEQVRG